MTQRNLRQRPRISYYEPEEPDLDQYVFCEKCGDYVYEYCSIHGPLLVIPDDKVPAKPNVPSFVPRAALTIPHVFLHITYSIIPDAGLGVFSSLTLPSGVRFGPYRGQRTDVVDSSYCWQIYDKNRKPLHCVDAADASKSNWMRYVNCARHWKEQNLVAFQYQGELYYRTIKIIPRFTELMVFYGSEFACELDVDLGRYNSPAGYAQKFGAPAKKRKLNDDTKTKTQKDEIQTASGNTTATKEMTMNPGANIKDITTETQRGQVIITTCPEPVEATDAQNETAKETTDTKATKSETKNNNVKSKKGTKTNKTTAKNNKESQNAQTKKTPIKKAQTKENTTSIDKPNNDIQKNRHVTNNLDRPELNVNIGTANTKILDLYTYCNDCNKRFISKQDLQKHLRFHDLSRAYPCDVCKLRYITLGSLTMHINNLHTKLQTYACKVCGKKFTHSSSIKRHMRTHTGEKPYACKVCDKKFNDISSIKKHMRTHTGEKPYACKVCDKKFNQISNIKTHMRTHTGEKPYACKVCDKKFNDISSIKKHMRTHTGEKPYACKVCDKKFNQISNIKTHMRTHTGEKPYACKVCDKKFNQISHIKRHKCEHTREKSHTPVKYATKNSIKLVI